MKKPVFLLIAIFSSLLIFSPLALAEDAVDDANSQEDLTTQSSEDYLDRIDSIQKEIEETENNLMEVQQKKRSLRNEIAYMKNQIYLTTLEIQETETRIKAKESELEKLQGDIDGLEERIQHLSELLVEQQEILRARARENYKSSRLNGFEILFGASTISRLVDRLKYLRVLELQDQRLIEQMKSTRQDCSEQKELLEMKEQEVSVLKAEIESYQDSLEGKRNLLSRQKAEQEHLLAVTKGKEAEFQKRLNQLLAEKEALESIYFKGLSNGTKVEKGQPIARMGNTGAPCCSTGVHLHFEVRECDEDGNSCETTNPANYLKDGYVNSASFESQVEHFEGSGDWSWPVKKPFRITQEYGETFWTRAGRAPYAFHTGIDIAGPSPGVSVPVYAVDDGVMYKSSVACGYCTAKYVAIDHGDGLWTIYFHVQ